MDHHEHHQHHISRLKKHRNVLYILLALLVLIQTISFVALSSQVSRLDSRLDSTRKDFSNTLKENNDYYQQFIQQLDMHYQKKINELSSTVADQEQSFAQQLSLLKASHEDFSGIISDAIQGVVSVGTEKSAGSGFIMHEDGYIVTNAHVINGAKSIKVVNSDGKSFPAGLVGIDSFYDIALLKVDGKYNILSLSNSDQLQVGKKVIAIGNPYGLSFSVTEGIISAIDRTGPNGKAEYIQTDVSLNPGNSGGPLIDTQGKVVGINNFKVSSAESLGFALESNSLKQVVNKIANSTLIR
ncbi:trypsin-like serine protease [Candidatus Pacearchaeota archaeon]|nr:trypsin-like serine protease [Candidatus Pacearchaeota archaeon]